MELFRSMTRETNTIIFTKPQNNLYIQSLGCSLLEMKLFSRSQSHNMFIRNYSYSTNMILKQLLKLQNLLHFREKPYLIPEKNPDTSLPNKPLTIIPQSQKQIITLPIYHLLRKKTKKKKSY